MNALFSVEEQAQIAMHQEFEASLETRELLAQLRDGMLTSVEFSMRILVLAQEKGLEL